MCVPGTYSSSYKVSVKEESKEGGEKEEKENKKKEKERKEFSNLFSVQFSSVAQSCPTLCDPMECSTPGLPVYHRLLEFTQTHVH